MAITIQIAAIAMPTIASGRAHAEPAGSSRRRIRVGTLDGLGDAHQDARSRGSMTPYSTSTRKLIVM